MAGVLVATALLLTGMASTPAASSPPVDQTHAVVGAGGSTAIPGSYVVKLKDSSSVPARGAASRASALATGYRGKVGQVWDTVLHGFSVTMSEDDAKRLVADPDVEYVQQQHIYHVADTQERPPSYGLDRVDQRQFPLDEAYTSDPSGGAGVHAYIIDSGIRTTHTDFGGRASSGFDVVDNDPDAQDCGGHGTHVAGIVGGTTYGVAKKVQLVAVRVFDCHGDAPDDTIVAGINWVVAHAIRPAVINMSIASECRDQSGVLTNCPTGVAQMIMDAEGAAMAAGIPVVTAAGNANGDACLSPVGAAAGTINVGAINSRDSRWVDDSSHGSNFGFCVDLWAPGAGIPSDYNGSDTDVRTDTGTSMAAPHVTGAVALLMGTPQFAGATPAQIATELNRRATTGAIVGLDNASPNKLLFTSPPPVTGGSSVALTRNADGRLEMAGVNKDGFMLVRAQSAVNSSTWGPWTQSQKPSWFSVAAEPNTDGRMELTALTWLTTFTSPDEIWHRQQFAINANSWTNLSQLDGALTSVAMARNSNGRLEMVGTNEQGQVLHRLQTDANATTWLPFAPFPGSPRLRAITAETRADGRMVVVAVDTFSRVFATTQAVAGTDTWSAFAEITPSTGARPMGEVALARNANGTLELVGTDGAGGVWHTTQIDNWAPWLPLSTAKTLRHVAAETNADGRVQVVGVDNTGAIWQSVQNSPGSGVYSNWTQIDGNLRA